MSISIHDAAIPSFQQFLHNLAGLIATAEAHCSAHGLAPETLLQARLADDMWPFAGQVLGAVTNSRGHIEGMLAGTTGPNPAAPPRDFAGLKACVDDAQAGLAAIDPARLNALAGGTVRFVVRDHHVDFTAEDFLFSFCLPNFYFHVTTAYDILRAKGLPLAKRDYLGKMRTME